MEELTPLSHEAAILRWQGTRGHVYDHVRAKDIMEIEEKPATTSSSQQIELILRCAENGTWVLISTLKFPAYWHTVSRKLEKLAAKGKVTNTFRLFFDLQGYAMGEIPRCFLFDTAVKFYLSDRNNEDMEGFNDVWANILNDDLLKARDLNNVAVLEPHSNQEAGRLITVDSHQLDQSLSFLP